METATPMLKQYHTLKNLHQDCILFFRLGDFYEMFFEDAKTASSILDLVLTSRGKGTSNTIPMCGFPHHSADAYIAKLIHAGYKVAICEQLEDPAAAKGIVKRDVTRIITSGTYLDEHSSDTRYLLSLSPNAKSIGLAFTDPTTGTIQTNQLDFNAPRIIELLAKLPVYECIFPNSEEKKIKQLFQNPLLKLKNISLSPYDDWCFNPDMARKTLCEHFSVANLRGFGIEEKIYAASSTGALLEYLKAMNKQPLRHMDKISLYSDNDYAFISPAAHRGLELDTLIKSLDETVTPLGRRLFHFWFTHPLKQMQPILQRQEAVKILLADNDAQIQIKTTFSRIGDIEKNISRLSCGYTHAKDLLAIRNTLALLPELKETMDPLAGKNPIFKINDIDKLRTFLEAAINEDVPLSKPEGKIIRPGFHKELDDLRQIQSSGHGYLKDLQQREIKRTGINSLKIGYNKVFGYYLEITRTHSKNVPSDYIRKQTLVNAERYITPELKEYEEKILTAQDKILKIENDLVRDIHKKILDHSVELHHFCEAVAVIDVIFALTKLAQRPDYICPVINDGALLDIRDGRHPVVEQTLEETFVANDTLLDTEHNHLTILTGPNMAGKSTYIRQTAILVIMAQTGSFIPASSASVGLVDKIFTRIGAHDDISRGQSTFMVEMNEAADILNNLTSRSLVILDEIGRGTSTYDGLSLAWALAEHLAQQKVRSLFATHFHELTALADQFEGVKNYNVAVKEWKDEIIFLHKIVAGSTDDSYGIYVAKLAGIPKNIIDRAKSILTKLELQNNIKHQLKDHGTRNDRTQSAAPHNLDETRQLNFFNSQADPVAEKIKQTIQKINVNELTPLEAMNRLAELKKMVDSDS